MPQQPTPIIITTITLILCIVSAFTRLGVKVPSSQQPTVLTATAFTRLPRSPAPSMPTHSKEADRHRKEEEAMAQSTLEREKEAAARQLQEEAEKAAVSDGLLPLPVVFPPSASNLTSLLTGHVGQDADRLKMEEEPVLDAMDNNVRVKTSKP